jgi:hypothetical protein
VASNSDLQKWTLKKIGLYKSVQNWPEASTHRGLPSVKISSQYKRRCAQGEFLKLFVKKVKNVDFNSFADKRTDN